MQLATHALDESQLRHLAAAIEAMRKDSRPLVPLKPFKLGIVGNGTLDPLLPVLTATAARHGILLECVKADFGETISASLSDAPINCSNPDAVLCMIDYRGLPMANAVEALNVLGTLRTGFHDRSRAPCIVQTLAPPPESVFGSFDRAVPGTLRQVIGEFNRALVESIRNSPDIILDVAAIAETVGLANWYSAVQWNLGKFSFDARYLPLYADHVCRLIAALRGMSRRCLILDLDNTIWGGVIGDDGLEGIVIGQGDATGEAYLDLQRTALSLRERGVLLAVSSKNNDDVARSAFVKHPEMLLRENHIAVFQANWHDKASNITAIAKELGLGLDAMVFVDDDPVERGLVRKMLPEVAVPELPLDPALFARTLTAAGYFETVTFSEEDRKRAALYEDNARRASLADKIGDIEAYLASLQMTIRFGPFDATGRSRIAQLINKSNQFNLTTRRYTELDIEAMEHDVAVFTLQVRLSDAFGDNGMIGVVICRPDDAAKDTWTIDTWLMSCRVLGRRVEQMVLREILDQAKTRGIRRLVATYIPSGRNQLVRDHYAKLGFRLLNEEPSGITLWELETAAHVEPAPMVVEHR
ncbi:MAG TPA: HAD-IIIC family phosphatase [Candidatus Rubrimentiphilum sp.]|nr:HAD-IIIC family phosphatase [Candidatus Rubrimentiphilum sp.]